MTTRERVLLALTVIGFVVPNVMLGIYVAENGVDVADYFGAWFGELPAAQITVDIGIAAVAFLLWAAWEGRRLGMREWWWPIPATALVGLCFGLPLFLLQRERALQSGEVRAPTA